MDIDMTSDENFTFVRILAEYLCVFLFNCLNF